MANISKKTLKMIDRSIKNINDAKPVDMNKIKRLLNEEHTHNFNSKTGQCKECYMSQEELFILASGEHPTEEINYE